MKILCIGDIVGCPGRLAVMGLVEKLKQELAIDFVIANGENAAGGSGITSRLSKQMLAAGCDVITLGDHVWDQKELGEYLKTSDRVIRPANFPPEAPGRGWIVQSAHNGVKVGVFNLLGRTFMRYNVDCPFRAAKKIIEEIKKETPIIILDMHAETTSEKNAIGHFLDGEVSAVVGTHTHIQTADEKILPKGTAYITDLGMTGPYDSVIGQNKDNIIARFLSSMPVKFSVAKDDVKLHGVLIDVDESTGKARSIERIQRSFVPKVSEMEIEDNQ